MIKLIKKSRKEHVSDSGIIIPKGSTYAIEKFVMSCDGDTSYERYIYTYDEYREAIKLIYREKQREIRYEKFIEKIEKEFGINWSAYKYDSPTIEYKKGVSLKITIYYSDMVTDDPFPMYDDFVKKYFFTPK